MSSESGPPPAVQHGQEDNRPVYRIALFGVAAKFQRMLEIVVRHARHNHYRYRIAEERKADSFDVAMVDMSVPGGPEIAATLEKLLEGRPILRLGRRLDPSRPRDDVVHSAFPAQVLDALNGFVEQHLGARPGRSLAGIGVASNDVIVPVLERAPVEAQRPLARRPRALIVDDSPTVRRQLSVALHQMGMDSEAVGCAREALDLLSTREYELVFADVVMPEQDGYQLTREIKRDRSLKGMPVIILTTRSSPFDLARGALAGCSSYLVKPVSLQSLRDTVKRQLQKVVNARSKRAAEQLIGA